MKKLILLATVILLVLSLCGCENTGDCVEVWNRNCTIFDNIEIKVKDGYFYDTHEKFIVDENTVGVTVYFSKDTDIWEVKGGAE